MPNQVIHIFTTVADRFFELQKLGLAGYSGLSRRTTSCPIRVTTRIFRTSLLFGLFFLPLQVRKIGQLLHLVQIQNSDTFARTKLQNNVFKYRIRLILATEVLNSSSANTEFVAGF